MSSFEINTTCPSNHLQLLNSQLYEIEFSAGGHIFKFRGLDHHVTLRLPNDVTHIIGSSLNLIELYPAIRKLSL